MSNGTWRSRIVGYGSVDPRELTANPANWRTHPDNQRDALHGVLDEVGWVAEILVNQRTGFVVDGHLRVASAVAHGEALVPVRYVDLDDAEERLVLATLDPLSALATRSDEQLTALLDGLQPTSAALRDLLRDLAPPPTKVLNPDDADLTPPAEPVTQPGDLWLLGEHRLLCGDSLADPNIRYMVGAERIACTFTSPPYAVGLDYGLTYEDSIDNLRVLLPSLAEQAYAYTEPGGFAAVNFNDVAAGHDIAKVDGGEPCEYPMALEHWPVFRAVGWLLHTRRIWAKPHARVWSPWAIQSCRAASDWEHLWVWKRPGKAITGRGERSAFGVWDTSADEGVAIGKDEHGAGMATSFARWVLETHSRTDDVVWEPFAGTGTTLIAAEQTSRRCRAGEINPGYCDVIVRRWEAVTGRKAERVGAAAEVHA
jgi:DNA modification methylase